MLTATSAVGGKLFSAVEVARLYYIALVAHLSRTSGFGDCRAALVLAAQSLFAADPQLQAKVDAIKAAYDAVGISDPQLIA